MTLIDLVLGLGIFLFGMQQLEQGIKALGSDSLKQVLSVSTRTPISSVFTGTVITAIMQSSSMVGLLVLAFASAGVIPLFNAIGIVLGANLGTTFTGWIVTFLGFKLDLDLFAVPTIGLGCLIQIFASRRIKLVAFGQVLLGLGLLLFGLEMMKTAVQDLPSQLDIMLLSGHGPFVYLIVGVIFTAIVQSSSAVMMITLSSLYGGLIDLPAAAAIIIGADLGTTSTTALGSIKGSVIKRQVALAHIMFNLIVDTLAFIFLLPILPRLLSFISMKDPLYSLVAFHSFFNLIGLALFIPFLKQFANWLQRLIPEKEEETLNHYLQDRLIQVPEAALIALENEVRRLLQRVLSLNLHNLKMSPPKIKLSENSERRIHSAFGSNLSFDEHYEDLKRLEGEILFFCTKLETQLLKEEETARLMQLLSVAREVIYSAKSVMDIRKDLIAFRNSNKKQVSHFFAQLTSSLEKFYYKTVELSDMKYEASFMKEVLDNLKLNIETLHLDMHQDIFELSQSEEVEELEISTLLNINREVWVSCKSLIEALSAFYQLDL